MPAFEELAGVELAKRSGGSCYRANSGKDALAVATQSTPAHSHQMASLPSLRRKYPMCRPHARAARAFQTLGEAARDFLQYCRSPKSNWQCAAGQKTGPNQTNADKAKGVPLDQSQWIPNSRPRPCPKDGCALKNEHACQRQAEQPASNFEYVLLPLAGFRPPRRCDPTLTCHPPLALQRRAFRIKSKTFCAASGIFVPGPKIAATPEALR